MLETMEYAHGLLYAPISHLQTAQSYTISLEHIAGYSGPAVDMLELDTQFTRYPPGLHVSSLSVFWSERTWQLPNDIRSGPH